MEFSNAHRLLAGITFCLLFSFPLNCRAMQSRPQSKVADLYGIYTCTLDGKNVKPVITDSYREMNHARVSPDKKWVTFSRFNTVRGGLAEEKHGFNNSEIMIVRLDGSGLQTLAPPHPRRVSVNSYWMPDSKGLIYISNNNAGTKLKIHHIDIETRKTRQLPTPEGLMPSDPHCIGGKLVFPIIRRPNQANAIWIMNLDGGNARQLTHPVFPEKKVKLRFRLGDSDPKLSPDGTKVAFTRNFGMPNLHTIILDLKTGKETDISKSVTCDYMPEWSSDGKLLIYSHTDVKKLSNSGLYTIRPDGTERKRIPVLDGYFCKMPAFFPDEGSNPQKTRIIFTARDFRRR
ncbi:MAG: TolB family protein [Planctomycetota bacterium]|jgi:Tol biopolymer transport system component